MAKQLVEKQSNAMANFRDIERVAGTLYKSGLFNHLGNVTQAVAVIEFGREIGIQPMQSLQSMAVIKGKIAMTSQLMLALVKKQGCDVEIIKQTNEECVINFIRDDKKNKVTFTFEEAKQLGAASDGKGGIKDNYKKQPANMLFWRVVGKGIRYYAPDLLLKVYSIEELTEGRATTVDELGESDRTIEDWGTKEGYDKVREFINDPRIEERNKAVLIKGINADSTEEMMLNWILGVQPELAEVDVAEAKMEETQVEEAEKEEFFPAKNISPPSRQTKQISPDQQDLFDKLIKSHIFPKHEAKQIKVDFLAQPSEVLSFLQEEIARRKIIEKMLDAGQLTGESLKTLSKMTQDRIEHIAIELQDVEKKKDRKEKLERILGA